MPIREGYLKALGRDRPTDRAPAVWESALALTMLGILSCGGGTTGPASPLRPIMFLSGRDGGAEVYVMNVDGSNPIQATVRP